jgi:hypothetical protein
VGREGDQDASCSRRFQSRSLLAAVVASKKK